MVRRLFVVAQCLLAATTATAQTLPILDQNPASLHWYRLSTPHFRVLYPGGFDSTAQRTANRLEQLYEPASASLGKSPRRVSVILQNQTTVNNSFFTLFPRRTELFAVPAQSAYTSGTLDWLDLVAVHEYRHVVQADKALQGYGRALYSILGNVGLGLAEATVPDWFAEGDAVSTETLLSTGGRGRIPNFALGIRTNLLAGQPFSYQKAVGGSYRDNVPNHYVLGYFMTTYLKRTYGPDVWSRVLNRNYHRFPWPFAFSASIREETQLRTEELYRKTMDDLTETWQKQQAGLTLTPATLYPTTGAIEKRTTAHPVFTNYRHPQFLTDSTLLCVKSGLGDTPRLVVLSGNGREKTVHVQGFPNDPDLLSATAEKAAWIEFGYDPRWGQRDYSTIRLLDLKTGKLTRLGHRTRYMVVSLSPDNTRLAVVENTDRYTTRLLVLDAKTGAILKTVNNPDNAVYQQPRWSADNESIVVVTLKDGQKAIEQINTRSGERRVLLPPANENISQPQPWSRYVLYSSPRSGIDNLLAVDTSSKAVFQVTSRPDGAYHASVSPSGNRLAFEDFSATGYRIADMPLTPAAWTPLPQRPAVEPMRYMGTLPQQEPGAALGRQILADSARSVTRYTASRFRRLANAINVYSWGPVASSTGQALSVGISSQDLLSTTQIGVGYTYNQAEQTGNAFALLSYQGLYPIIDLSFQRGNRRTSLYVDRIEPLDSLRSDTWQYNQLTAGFRLPLQLTHSRYIQNLNLSAYYNFLQVTGYDLPYRYATEVGSAGSLNALTYGFSYARLLRQSKRDVAPRWGQTVSVNYRTTPFGGKLTAEQIGFQANLYFPGLLKHHSLRFRGGYQQQAKGTYTFGPLIFFPRGKLYLTDDQIKAASVEYRLPIADTHWSLGRWLYVQRIKANVFYDRSEGQSSFEVRDVYNRLRGYETRQNTFQTTGLDVSFIFNALRLRTPFEAGFRTILDLNTRQWLVQPLVIDIGF